MMPGSVSDNDSLLLEEFPEEEAPTLSDVPGEEGEASSLPSSSFDDLKKQHDDEAAPSSEDPLVLVDAGSDAILLAIQEQTNIIYSGFTVMSIFLGFIIGALTVKGLHAMRR